MGRIGLIALAIVLIGIVVASVVLIVAKGRLWNWYYTSTPVMTTTSKKIQYVSLEGPTGFVKEILDKFCGKSENLLVLLYLKTKPNSTYVNMLDRVFNNVLSKYSKVKGGITTCLINISRVPELAKEIKSYAYPVVALAIKGDVAKEVVDLFKNVQGLLVAKQNLQSYLIGQLTQFILYEQVPIETNVEPKVDNATPVLGSKSAPVYLFIYEDTHCPYCAMFYHEAMDKLLELVKEGKLAIVFKNFIVHRESYDQHVYIEAMYLATRNASKILYLMERVYESLYDVCFVKHECTEEAVSKVIGDVKVFSLIEKIGGLKISQLRKYENVSKEVVDYDTSEALKYSILGTPGFIIWNRVKHYGLIVVGAHSAQSMLDLIERVSKN